MKKYYYFELKSDCYLLSKVNSNIQGIIFASFESMKKYAKEDNSVLIKGTNN